MNRKGHTPTLLIAIVTIVLMVAAIVTFVQANKPVGSFSKELGQGLRTQGQYEKYVRQTFEDSVKEVFSISGNLNHDTIKTGIIREVGLRDYELEGAGNFFLIVKRGNFDVTSDGTNWAVNINGVFVPYSSGTVELTHTFNATAIVSSDGSTQYIYK